MGSRRGSRSNSLSRLPIRTLARTLRRVTRSRWMRACTEARASEPQHRAENDLCPSDKDLPENCFAADGPALQVLPVVFRVRGAGDQQVRHTARACACRVAVAQMQPMEPRRV